MDQGNPLEQWIRFVFGAKKSKSLVNVPRKFCWMPCGCKRQPSEQLNQGATETWHLVRKGDDIVHTECERVVLSLNPVPQRPLWGLEPPDLEDVRSPEPERPAVVIYIRAR